MIHSTTTIAKTAAMSSMISRPMPPRYGQPARHHNETPGPARLPGLDPVQHLRKGPECRAGPAPHAASAPQDRSRRAAGDPARVQRLVQLDQPQPEFGEAEHLRPGLREESEVVRLEPGRDGNHPVPVDEPRVVAARLKPGRGALRVQPDRLQMLPKLPGARLRLSRRWLCPVWLARLWPRPI